jgi:large subunit ribosomal protein L4
MTTVNVQSPTGDLVRSVELPDAIFGVQVNVPLLHQVVVAQLAAARQGTHDTKTRGEVSGGGRKPYRQKGTGRARQGSIRAPQFAGGGVVHGPTPRDYSQRTPKKMKAAALRGALSDRAGNGRVHVVAGLVEGEAPSTKSASAALARIVSSRHILLVVEREDVVTWKSLRNVPTVHVIAPDQLNTYDVLVSDDVVFTEGALAAFLAPSSSRAGHDGGKTGPALLDSAPATKRAEQLGEAVETLAEEKAPAGGRRSAPTTSAGTTAPAGAGVSDAEMAAEVAEQTSPDLKAEDVFEREADSAATATEAAEASAEELEGEK